MRPALLLLSVLLIAGPVLAGEPDWFTRVKRDGLAKACEVEVERHEKGILEDSLHVGECYYNLKRWSEGLEVFRKLLRSSDRNYAAVAMARMGEGLFHLGKPKEAEATFKRCLEEHPEAWLDGSIAERCRAWLRKLDGKLVTPERTAKDEDAEKPEIEKVKEEVEQLNKRIEELKRLIRELGGK